MTPRGTQGRDGIDVMMSWVKSKMTSFRSSWLRSWAEPCSLGLGHWSQFPSWLGYNQLQLTSLFISVPSFSSPTISIFFLENPTIFISSYKNMFSHIVRTDWRWFMKIKGIEQWKKERKNEEFGKYNNVNKCENNS